MSVGTMQEKKGAIVVAPFGIEVDHPRCCDILVQSIPGCRLRSKIKPVTTTVQGQVRTPLSGGVSIPEVPGMQLHVNPAELSYVIFDPLNEDEDAKHRIKRFLSQTTGTRTDAHLKGVDTLKGKLDPHRMKTLCRELLQLIEDGQIRVVKGPAPSIEDIEDLPGNFLLNPGLRTQTTQPVFEKDWGEWVNQLTRSGG